MINLEELKLYLLVFRWGTTYIDGIQLYDQFLIHMTQLKKFTFSINTRVYDETASWKLPSNEDVQRSFIGRGYQQVASSLRDHTDSRSTEAKCHIYSLPYEFEYFLKLDNFFQGGMFAKVRYLSMISDVGFEYKLFQLISQDFPVVEFLYIDNSYRMKDKQDSLTSITFPHVTLVDLKHAHVDYAELFLLKKKMHLPRLLNLSINYKSLIIITNNFTNNAMHFNFETLKSLDVYEPFVRPNNFHEYFPLF
jgi:hypothetical protein